MLRIIRERARQGRRTAAFPAEEPVLPERFRGLPRITREKCDADCAVCAAGCPHGALSAGGEVRLDLGRCLFCADCPACAKGCLEFTHDYKMAAGQRSGLRITGQCGAPSVQALDKEMRRLFGRSLSLRQVSAGGCNGCEADVNVLGTVVFDMARFGIRFTASPRHADGLLITGPVTRNMRSALLATYEAVPAPKLVIVAGACAIAGGPFRGGPEVGDGVGDLLPVDLYIPGCPPHPYTTLDGLLRLLGRL